MLFGEGISKGINKQIGNQPESWKNAASRLVDKKFGKADSRILDFIHGKEPETPQAKMDLADAILKTPNYLLEKTINLHHGRDESSEQVRERVASEVSRLFDLLHLTSVSHTEDIRSEKALALTERPQQIFDGLLKESLNLEDGKIGQQLQLSIALVDSQVAKKYNLVIDEFSVGHENISLNTIVQRNMEQKFAEKVQGFMSQYEEQWKADFGIQRCGALMRIGKEVLGESFIMPESVVQGVLNQIAPTVEAAMDKYKDRWKAKFGISKHGSLEEKLKDQMHQEMPDIATQIVLDQITPTIRAEMDQVEEGQWQADFGIKKWSNLAEQLKADMGRDMPESAIGIVLDQIEISVSATMNKYKPEWRADFGIRKYESIGRLLNENVGVDMPHAALDTVLLQITPTIEATMAQYKPEWRADFGIHKYEFLAKLLQDKIGKQMPVESAEIIINQMAPTIRAEMDRFEEQWKIEFGSKKASTLNELAKSTFKSNEVVLERMFSILSTFRPQATVT